MELAAVCVARAAIDWSLKSSNKQTETRQSNGNGGSNAAKK
jgi:hypothetical protein